MPSTRRFPPPWTIEERNDACFVVRDHKATNREGDAPWRTAANVAKLPELLLRPRRRARLARV
jgi:hypothetical protein